MPDGSGRKLTLPAHPTARPHGLVPGLDIERPQLLQWLRADMRRNLVLDKLSVSLRCACRDVARELPVVDAGANPFANGGLVRLDVPALRDRCDQLGQLDLRLALGAAERVELDLALARSLVRARIEFEPKRVLAALLDVASH